MPKLPRAELIFNIADYEFSRVLGEDCFEAAWASGRRMTMDEAIAAVPPA